MPPAPRRDFLHSSMYPSGEQRVQRLHHGLRIGILQPNLSPTKELSNTNAGLSVPMKRLVVHLHWCFGQFTHRHSVLPVARADRDEPRISVRASLKFREADRYERALLRDLVEISHVFGLRVAVL